MINHFVVLLRALTRRNALTEVVSKYIWHLLRQHTAARDGRLGLRKIILQN
jgi:hypothetical protein